MLYLKMPNGRYRVADEHAVRHVLTREMNRFREKFTTPAYTAYYLNKMIGHLEHELFVMLLLDNRHQLVSYEEVFRGTIDGANVYPREIAKLALQKNACSVVFAHNHPSGVCEPSTADEQVTKRLIRALALFDIRVLDHLIITEHNGYVSMAERGLL